jgi:ubiquinone/menaquinone biosynthesis C-methylase UbiE
VRRHRLVQGFYDSSAGLYDRVIAHPRFSPVVWGCSSTAYADWYRKALSADTGGRILDMPCGSLVFSNPAITEFAEGSPFTSVGGRSTLFDRLVLGDHSIGMLQRTRVRQPHAPLIRADLFKLPFGDATFSTVLCSGLLHVIGSSNELATELRRITQPGGTLMIYTLVRGERRRGNAALGLLAALGQATKPEQGSTVTGSLRLHFNIDSAEQRGNMLFVMAKAV